MERTGGENVTRVEANAEAARLALNSVQNLPQVLELITHASASAWTSLKDCN